MPKSNKKTTSIQKPKEFQAVPIEQINVTASDEIDQLLCSFQNMGFNAKRLAHACIIYKKMMQDPSM